MTLSLPVLARATHARRARLAVFATLGAAAAAVPASGCSSTTSMTGSIPPGIGVSCTTTTSATDSATAKAALGSASSGTCVTLAAGSYAGPFTVPAGVALVAQNGARATLTGGTAQDATVSLGEGSQLGNVDIVDPPGNGIAFRAANGIIVNVTVTGAKNTALAILCTEAKTPGCKTGTITLTDVSLSKSTLGLWVSGAHLSMKGGGSSNHGGTSLTSAAGVIAQAGAKLDMENVTVEKNQGVGILVDGASTTASMKNVNVNENSERGVWAQLLAGTMDAPAIKLDGCQLTKNKIVGLGAVESRGIIIVGGKVADTISSPLVTNLESTEPIGDGIGMFGGSGDFQLDSTELSANARAAGVFDASDHGIIIVGGKVAAGESGLKFVVQNSKSSANVSIPQEDVSTTTKPLGISAPKLALPPVL